MPFTEIIQGCYSEKCRYFITSENIFHFIFWIQTRCGQFFVSVWVLNQQELQSVGLGDLEKDPFRGGICPCRHCRRQCKIFASAQCVLCKVYFSAQPNNLKPILKFQKYYPFEHIFVPACSSARKIHFFKF